MLKHKRPGASRGKGESSVLCLDSLTANYMAITRYVLYMLCSNLYVIYRKTDSIHHHHPEGVVYRSVCLNSSRVAVSKVTSRRWWCIEYLFPIHAYMGTYIYTYMYVYTHTHMYDYHYYQY